MSLPRLAVAILALGLVAQPALAKEFVTVTLSDKPDMDMAVNDGIGMGGSSETASMIVSAIPAHLVSGSVTFNVRNASKTFVHEMLVVKLADTTTPLTYDEATLKLNEDKLGSLGEVSELDPGKSGALTLDLTPGTYALLCNQPGHYAAGMWTVLTIN